MGKRKMTTVFSIFLLGFYMAIVMYIFFSISHIDTLKNFEVALTFEIIGFVLLGYFVLGNILSKPIKTGYFVPLIMVTVIYTIILDIVNLVCVVTVPNALFILLNLIILFIYCMISVPMYIMGRR